MTAPSLLEAFLQRLERDIELQRRRVAKIGRELRSNLTDEDLLQPHDIPELDRSSLFNFEDGILAGLLQTKTALEALLLRESEK